MYRIGCCIPGGSFMPQGVSEIDKSPLGAITRGYNAVKECGYDYAEATVGVVMSMSEEEIEKAVRAGIRFDVCNSFIPPSLPIIATMDEDRSKLSDYVDRAMSRMKRLGGEAVVFGSGGARKLPEGMSPDAGMAVIDEFIAMCGEYGEKHGMYLALEPLNKGETNIINSVADGYETVKRVNHPHVKLLADSFHMHREDEPVEILEKVAKELIHIHVAESPERTYPGKDGGEHLKEFAAVLKKTDYSGRISVECSFKDFMAEAAAARVFLEEVFNK